MIGRLAVRSLTAHPVRSAVLAAGFGVGVAVMAILLGVAEIVLDQAQSPALVGGGDVLIRLSPRVPARLLLTGTLQSEALGPRVQIAAPFHTSRLYVVGGNGKTLPVRARGGIPSLERALDDRETRAIAEWRDSAADLAWTAAPPDKVLRHIDAFHPVPDAPAWASSWAEWLYFNGRARDTRFYLTFLAGPIGQDGRRTAGVRLQLERGGRMESYSATTRITQADALRAPDLTIGASSVRLEGMQYRVHLDLANDASPSRSTSRRVIGDLTLQASPGRLVPPLEITGAKGWLTGYVVPVMSGTLDGDLIAGGDRVSLKEGAGYHDHNWGFWQGVSWQWGQVQHEDLSFIYGRVFPPRDAADPDRMPGFMGALGPDGPLGFATDVTITETNDARGHPQRVTVAARGTALRLDLRFDVASATTTSMTQGPLGNGVDFLQLRGEYTVSGRAGNRHVAFTAPGAAETFRGQRAPGGPAADAPRVP